MAERDFDCIVVGAGHAGCEAAVAAARLGCRTLLLTVNLDRIAYMSCNPSIGGPAKGHVVRELAALGALMPYNTDRTFIQIRMLNTAKGPAVQALRAQADKALYSVHMKWALEREARLCLRQGMAVSLERGGAGTWVVQTAEGARFSAAAVILTTGTFLAARIMAGEWQAEAGRAGDPPAARLSQALQALGLELVRMQTNTPPRIDAHSVDFCQVEPQYGADEPLYFGLYYDREPPPPLFGPDEIHPVYPIGWQSGWRAQLPCYLVRTNRETQRIVLENLHRSPIAAGISQGAGPRYCPSFEEKVIRFPEREEHLVFLEPEGFATSELYVQGLFTAMPLSVQEEMLHSIPALREARITRPGYCVEYDVVRSGQIEPSLQVQGLPGLFLAGQINGTSGYEEAAAQGWLAGVNAALYAYGQEPLVLRRDQSYIGVLVDDLVTKQHTEPYRLFTSRAEFRLLLRQDNADLRLAPLAHRLGLVSDAFMAAVERKRAAIEAEKARLEKLIIRPDEGLRELLAVRGLPAPAEPLPAAQLLRWPGVPYELIAALSPPPSPLPPGAAETLEVEVKYAGYIERQLAEVEKLRRLEERPLPRDLDYTAIPGLRLEARERLARVRPLTVGQAARLEGVNPADVAILLAHAESLGRRREGCSTVQQDEQE